MFISTFTERELTLGPWFSSGLHFTKPQESHYLLHKIFLHLFLRVPRNLGFRLLFSPLAPRRISKFPTILAVRTGYYLAPLHYSFPDEQKSWSCDLYTWCALIRVNLRVTREISLRIVFGKIRKLYAGSVNLSVVFYQRESITQSYLCWQSFSIFCCV